MDEAYVDKTEKGARLRELAGVPAQPSHLEASIRRELWFSYGWEALVALLSVTAGALMILRHRSGLFIAFPIALVELARDARVWRRVSSLAQFLQLQRALFHHVPLAILRTDLTAAWALAAVVLLVASVVWKRGRAAGGSSAGAPE